jgi:hypothetical protein
VPFRRRLDPDPGGDTALVRFVDLQPRVDLEGEVLQADVVVAIGAAVSRPEPMKERPNWR